MAAEEELGLPPSVRLIRGARRGLHRRWPLLRAGAAAIGLLALIARVPYTVAAGQTGALSTFGRLHSEPIEPGLHLRLPLAQRVVKVATGEVSRVEVFGESVPELSFLSADSNLIDASIVVQYRIGSLGDYLFGSESPERLLRLVVRAALLEEMASTPVDDVLTSAKTAIQARVRASAQRRLDRHRSGLVVMTVNLQTVQPPLEVADAFRQVSDARAEAAQRIDKAEGERGRRLRLTRGRAEQIRAEARTEADTRLQEARGAADRFLALLESHGAAPGQTRSALYYDTLRKVLPRTKLIVLPPGESPRVDVNWIETPAAAPPQSTSPMLEHGGRGHGGHGGSP
ncbi:MAG: FtsH protease activity modulator HflK [Acidobacteriota bacterium]